MIIERLDDVHSQLGMLSYIFSSLSEEINSPQARSSMSRSIFELLKFLSTTNRDKIEFNKDILVESLSVLKSLQIAESSSIPEIVELMCQLNFIDTLPHPFYNGRLNPTVSTKMRAIANITAR